MFRMIKSYEIISKNSSMFLVGNFNVRDIDNDWGKYKLNLMKN